MLWIISIVIAFAFNLDSILMVRALSVDETLRAELVRSANEAIESKAEAVRYKALRAFSLTPP